MELSFCIVNTNGRELLLRCLAAIRDTVPNGLGYEVLVLDNGSEDDSAAAVRGWNNSPDGLGEALEVIERERRYGKAENDSLLLERARGELCLLLNEDSELRPGAVAELMKSMRADPRAGAAGAQLLNQSGDPTPSAWRLPGVGTALIGALFLHRIFVVQSGKEAGVRQVGWVQSAAMLVRKSAAAEVGYLDPSFFVYSDETDLCKRLGDAGWSILHVPAAQAVHNEQLSNDKHSAKPRAVEFHRNRDLYMRKHHGPVAATFVRALSAWSYAVRALIAAVSPAGKPGWMWLQAKLAWKPEGEGIRELAEQHNATVPGTA